MNTKRMLILAVRGHSICVVMLQMRLRIPLCLCVALLSPGPFRSLVNFPDRLAPQLMMLIWALLVPTLIWLTPLCNLMMMLLLTVNLMALLHLKFCLVVTGRAVRFLCNAVLPLRKVVRDLRTTLQPCRYVGL